MMQTLAAEAASLASIVKPIFILLAVVGWAKCATVIDKDTLFFHLNRRMWNVIQVVAAVVGVALMLLIPLFIVGYLLGLIVLGGGIVAYILFRNKNVPEDKKWHFDTSFFSNFIAKQKGESAAKKAAIRFKPAKGSKPGLKPVPLPDDAEYQAHMDFEAIFDLPLHRNAQWVEVVAAEQGSATTYSVDGVVAKGPKLPTKQVMAVIDYLKAMCALDVEDRRKKQTGRVTVETADLGTRQLKVSTSGSTRGIKCTILIDPVKQLTIAFKDLGLLEPQAEQVKKLIDSMQGTVLVSSPAGHGRTTLMYSLTEQHDPYTMDIHTIESEVERELEGIHQNVMDPAEVSTKLASLLLRDPQVVMVAAVADPATAKVIAQAGVEGRRIYAGLRADDAFTALRMWLKAVGDPDTVSRSIAASINQRLIRKLCTVCRQKYKPDAEALRKLNLPADKALAFYKSGGQVAVKNKMETCPACNGVGYLGRTGIHEVMVFDDEAKNLIRAGKLDELKAHLRRNRTLWLQEAAVAKVVAGETSISEVTRAMASEQKEGEAS